MRPSLDANMVLANLRAKEEKIIKFLSDLVSFESPSKDADSQEPIFKFFCDRLQEMGFHTFRMKGKRTGGYLFARPQQRIKHRPLQLLVGHCDTVWPRGTIQEMPLDKNENQLSGPGVYDMKAGLTQIVFALETIIALKHWPIVDPIILINADEEIGSRESSSAIRRLAKISQRAYILEPPLGLDGKLKTARKGLGRFTLKVKGQAAHAGLDPGKGANAIVELSHQVQKLFQMNDREKGISVNVGMIEGGLSANVVAPESKAVIDVRVLNQDDGEAIAKRIHSLKPELPGTGLEIEGSMGRPPMARTSRNQALWKQAKASGKLLGIDLQQATAGGGSDGNTTSLYTATLDGLGTTGDGAHAAHEFIFIDKLIERTALLALLLMHP